MIPTEVQKERVRAFWERDPCGGKHSTAPEGTPEYFAEVEQTRYRLEPFIKGFADFEAAAGKHVLEIGTGLGTDLISFARAGAQVTGVDLTEHAIALVRDRLRYESLSADLRVTDAEALPFDSGSFDVVYSWGVLHHTPDPPAAIREALRVARPGGRVCVMLYSRRSWVALGLWLRYGLMRGRPWRSLSDVISGHMESDGTRAFTKAELRELFSPLDDLTIDQVATPYDRRVAGPLAKPTGSLLGWFLVVRGRTPGAA